MAEEINNEEVRIGVYVCHCGVNIGGVGTLIASLASLITFKEYTKDQPGHTFSYVLKFTAFNVMFFVVLVGFCMILR